MRVRWSALVALVAMTLSACASGEGQPPSTAGETPATTARASAPETTVAPGPGGTEDTAAGTTTVPQVDGPAAPDFEFTLSDGSVFSLGDEQKPVYLVFWAEW